MQDFSTRAFNPQPDPPKFHDFTVDNTQGILIGLLLPAVQKAR